MSHKSFRVLAALPLILLVAASGAGAQGLRGGIVMSQLTDVEGVEARRGLVLGASFGLLRFGMLSIAPEVLYIQKGAKRETPTAVSGIDDIRIDYFEIPILARFGGYITGTAIRPSVYAGGYYGFETKCSFGFEDGGDRSADCFFSGLQEFGIDGTLKDNDTGWVLGGAVEMLTRVGAVSLDARYSQSFGKITREGSVDEPRNRGVVIMLGWSPELR